MGEQSQIDDKYDFSGKQAKGSSEEKRDAQTIKREEFLSIVKSDNGKGAMDSQDDD